jgi:hypothetical protein
MDNIYNPLNGKSYSIFTYEGKYILKQYIKNFQNGGMLIKLNKNMFKQSTDFGKNACVINTLNWIGIPANLVKELIKIYKKEKTGIRDSQYLKILDKWVNKLVQPTNSLHKRLIPGKIEPFEFVYIKNNQNTVSMVNEIYSYVKPMTSRILLINWEHGGSHLTCIGRDANNEPFIVELQNNIDEQDYSDCIHIPYGWSDILDFFSATNDVYILLGGPTLKPIKDSHKYIHVEDVINDNDNDNDNDNVNDNDNDNVNDNDNDNIKKVKKSHSVSEGQLSDISPEILKPRLTKTLSSKTRLVDRHNPMMNKIITSPTHGIEYGLNKYDDVDHELVNKYKQSHPDIYKVVLNAIDNNKLDIFIDLVEMNVTIDKLFNRRFVQNLIDSNYEWLDILMLQYHADPVKLHKYYSELELQYTTPDKILEGIEHGKLSNHSDITDYEMFENKFDDLITKHYELYNMMKKYAFKYFTNIIVLGYDTFDKIFQGLKDGSLQEILSQKEIYGVYTDICISKYINELDKYDIPKSQPGEPESKLMEYKRRVSETDDNDDLNELFENIIGEDNIFTDNLIDNLIHETEELVGYKINKFGKYT